MDELSLIVISIVLLIGICKLKEVPQPRLMLQRPRWVSHASFSDFISRLLPAQLNVEDVRFAFHKPGGTRYTPSQQVSQIILSITPTPGFYAALNDPAQQRAPACFLHRPWKLDRSSVRRGALILARHTAFDSNLTVGWNTALAKRLGLCVDSAVCIQGYKDDQERKIGLVAKLQEPAIIADLARNIQSQFGGQGDLFSDGKLQLPDRESENPKMKRVIKAVAIMNAFGPDEVNRAISAANSSGWLSDSDSANDLLYLTGEVRKRGLTAATAMDMPTVCVGHRACEEWGIRYLAEQARAEWPGLDVVEILEEEEDKHK